MQFYVLIWAFLLFKIAQLHLLTKVWTIFLITLFKIYEMPHMDAIYLILH